MKKIFVGKKVMKGLTSFFLISMSFSFLLLTSIHATNWTITNSADTTTGPVNPTLRYALLNAISGDTIVFDPSVTLINLANPLPTITQGSLTITGPVTIDSLGANSVFSVAPSTPNAGTLSLTNVIVQNGLSLGGSGGNGGTNGGGGGGAGGGGAIYIHNGAQVSLSTTQLLTNTAQGGAGGNNNGAGIAGGGGGFGGGGGGNGGAANTGGGGGGNLKGGAGGSGGSGALGGILNSVQSGGGGGGRGVNGIGSAGGTSFQPQNAATASLGGTTSGGGGGGGAGANPATTGSTAGTGGAGTATSGGAGGSGIGTDSFFAGGGGGGAPMGAAQLFSAGSGTGTGGGGGGSPNNSSSAPIGGTGGTAGGGGGGAGNIANSIGGKGGFGAGGGSGLSSGGGSLFGGGLGNTGIGLTAGGGGGAGMGGAIFIQEGATLTILDSLSLSGNQALSGSGPGGASNDGGSYGDDIFIRSGGTLIFSQAGLLTILSNIESNQGLIDGAVALNLGGGLIMNGTGTLTLDGTNTFTATTTIQSGTLSVSSDDNLGDTTLNGGLGNNIVIGNGTLQITNAFSSLRSFSLTGGATIDTTTSSLTIRGIISGSGSLTKQGTGTLNITPISTNVSSYSGGLTIAEGTVLFSADMSLNDSALGALTKLVTMESGTTLISTGNTATINSIRPFLLNGPATFDTETIGAGTTFIVSGNITGSGSLTKTGNQDLILLGTNSYSGGTELSAGRIAGNTSSLQGNITIDDGATLIFLQTPIPGTFNGTVSTNLPLNSGILQIGNLNPTPFQAVTIATSNPNFFGPTNILQSGVLKVNGSLANSSLVTISSGGFLSGIGTVGPVNNSGTIRPGNSIGTLTVNGDLTLNGSSLLIIEISPTDSSRLAVLGNATLAGNLEVLPDITGFYGLGNSYTILTNTGVQSGTFSLPVISSSNFPTTVTYFPNSVVLTIQVEQPFLNFPFENPNEQSVGENIDALSEQGYLTPNSPLGEAINSLIGFPDSAINNALDQMHPASFSAFAEIQAALGGQLLTLFHRRPTPHCACSNSGRLWLEPYGNWLKEKNLGYQLGFHAYSKGVAFGLDGELTDGWVLGFGAAWNDTHMHWAKGRGSSTIKGYYGSIYTDYTIGNFYLGLSCIGGWDNCHSSRHIRFSTINEHAHSTRHNLELMGQLSTAFFFGPDFCFAFPYLNIDYLYLREKEAHESGAPGLNLQVNAHSGSTLRSEAGFAVQVQDINKAGTMCVSPLFGLGWAMEMPINRSSYRSNFEGQPISFETHGWDYTWQLFTLRFGFSITYRCLSLSASYVAEMSPLEHTPFFDERGDIRLELNW